MPLRDGFFSTATQTSCCNRIQRSNRVRLLVVSTHDFPDIRQAEETYIIVIATSMAAVVALKKLNASKPFEHPPNQGGKLSTRLAGVWSRRYVPEGVQKNNRHNAVQNLQPRSAAQRP